jgi:hypothetical protein
MQKYFALDTVEPHRAREKSGIRGRSTPGKDETVMPCTVKTRSRTSEEEKHTGQG